MTFNINCVNCQATFAGKSEYVGRRIRCPKCQEVFRVEAKTESVYDPAIASSVATPSALQEEYDEWNVPDDFEYKIKDVDEGQDIRCGFCHEPMKPNEVLCMKCGFHSKLGKKIETKSGADADFGEKPQAIPGRISFGTFSLPVMPLAIAGGGAVLIGLLLLLIAPFLFAMLCLLAGLVLSVVGHFWIVVVAFREDTFQGLLVWLMPVYWWVYVFTHWEETWLGFAIWGLGCFLIAVCIGVMSSIAPDAAVGY